MSGEFVCGYCHLVLIVFILPFRKMAKNAGQFKTIVSGARKGAAAGSKIRLMKAKK